MDSSKLDCASCVGGPARRTETAKRQRACLNVLGLGSVTLLAAALSACVHSSGLGDGPTSRAVVHQSSTAQVEAVMRQQSRRARNRQIARTAVASRQYASNGLASYYSHGSRTASGEKFNAGELTAAHPTLPFGTRVRVTNVNTGKSVMVRVNDRGPFVRGRVIDVSRSAAESLGMVGRGVAKVKLDVVE
jgi:rare lipoprotein A